MKGTFGYDMGRVKIAEVVVFGLRLRLQTVTVEGKAMTGGDVKYNSEGDAVTVSIHQGLGAGFEVTFA